MNFKTTSFLFLFVLVINIQCTKKNADTIVPSISLVTPKNNDTINGLQSLIPIEFVVTDNYRLDEMEMNIYDSIGKNVAQEKTAIFGTSFHYTNVINFQSSSTKMRELELEIKIKDKSGNSQSSRTKFYIVTKS
jgi:hypothetical protein